MYQWIGLALAGAAGTLARFGLGGLVQRVLGPAFPWGTLVVNILGCLLFGVFVSLAEHKIEFGEATRNIVLVGFLGAFTTFSTLAFHTGDFLRANQWVMAFANLTAHNAIGLAFLFAGFRLGRLL